MPGSQMDDGLEIGESPLDSPVTALQTGSLEMELSDFEDTPLDEIGDVVLPDWAPTLQDIADRVPEFTRGRVDGDGEQSGEERLVFGHDTDPSDQEVEGYLVAAVNEVVGRVDVSLTRLNRFGDLARSTVALRVVMMIERKLLSHGAADADGAYQATQRDYLGCLQDLTVKANRATPDLV